MSLMFPSLPSLSPTFQEVNDLKAEIDKLLMEWKPQNSKSMAVGNDADRWLAFIKREHSVFSALSFTSSLLFGDYFIHSCYWIWIDLDR